MVDAVVPVPWGAYPTSLFPEYTHDKAFYAEYSKAARSPETFGPFWAERVVGPDTQAAFLNANGGAATLLDVKRRTA